MDATANNRNHRHAIIKSKSYFRNVVNDYDPKISISDVFYTFISEKDYVTTIDNQEKVIIACNVIILVINLLFFIILFMSGSTTKVVDLKDIGANNKTIIVNQPLDNINDILSYVKITLASLAAIISIYKLIRRLILATRQSAKIHNLEYFDGNEETASKVVSFDTQLK